VEDQHHMEEAWVRLIRRGEALRALEASLDGHSPAGIRERISRDQVSRGELLWQGTSGYCVVQEDCRRSQANNVPVLRLQGTEGEGLFRTDFIIPMQTLLDIDVLPITECFGIAARDTIHKMLNEISENYKTT